MPSAPTPSPLRAARRAAPRAASAGFTLIELMVVVALIALASAGASLALRDSAASALERDAQRLAAVLEAGRAQARASELPLVLQLQADGFVLRGLPRPESPQRWLSPLTRTRAAAPIVLGPEPLIPPQTIELYSAQDPQQRLWLRSDGLRPFSVLPAQPVQPMPAAPSGGPA